MFCFSLCEYLGGITVTELMESMDSWELTTWRAFFNIKEARQKQDEVMQSGVQKGRQTISRRRRI